MRNHLHPDKPVVAMVDGTDDGLRALRYAVARARALRTNLHVVHIVPSLMPLTPMEASASAPDLAEAGQEVVDQGIAAARDLAPELEVTGTLAHHGTYDAVVEESRRAGCLVLGSRPRSSWRPSIGSTVAVASAGAHCPVIAVPASWEDEKENGSVIVAVSHQQEMDELVAAGIAEAQLRGTDMVVLHAWRPPDPYVYATATRVQEARWAEATEREIAESTAGTRSDNPDVAVRFEARFQAPGRALADLAPDASLVLVGRHHTMVGLLPLLGRVPRAAVELGLCPVEVVPTTET